MDFERVKLLLERNIIDILEIPKRKGSKTIFIGSKVFYVWKNDKYLFFKQEHFWNRKYRFKISSIS